ncbi:MAG: hypothetical protein AAF483_03035 [Planctomycetota bacterium]
MKSKLLLTAAICGLCCILGCPSNSDKGVGSGNAGESAPSFTLSWSEYPSWSVFGVAEVNGLIDGEEGAMGTIEEKWNVDIVLNLRDYDTCITEYATNVADAVCITNMDILSPAVSRPAVAILPTSTSDGADACIVVGIEGIDGLAGKDSRGLEKSVSQYCFERVLEENGKDPANFPFKNMDPGEAAKAMQLKQDVESIVVWNPFVIETLRKREDAKVLFDSTAIKEEIIDMLVIGKDSLEQPGGQRFAYAAAEAFYEVNKLIEDPSTQDETLIALGERFAKLELEDMKTVVTQTKFYKTAGDGLALFEDKKFQDETMPAVAEFLITHDMAEKKPEFGFNAAAAQLNFDSQFMIGTRDGVDPASIK